MTGGTVPGVPFTILGHNEKIAWGLTITHSDLQDLFIKTLVSDGYLTSSGIKTFEKRTEIIGAKVENDVEIVIRQSIHGPIISDALPTLKKALNNQ